MSILSEYRSKRAAMRQIHKELVEVANATDLSVYVKNVLICNAHRNKVRPGLSEMYISDEQLRLEGYDSMDKIRNYLSVLDRLIGYDPVDPSMGQS